MQNISKRCQLRGYYSVQCPQRGVLEEEGKFWCQQHAPSTIRKRREDRIRTDALRMERAQRYRRTFGWNAAIAALIKEGRIGAANYLSELADYSGPLLTCVSWETMMEKNTKYGNPCPLCGLYRKTLKQHINSQPCRAEQIIRKMREEHRLFPLPQLCWASTLKWSNLPYERVPANYRQHDNRPGAWGAKTRFDYSAPLYKGLGDVLFVEEWVVILLRYWGMSNPPVLSNRTYTKAQLKPLVCLLKQIQSRDDEFKKALITTYAIGGDQALNVLLISEGL